MSGSVCACVCLCVCVKRFVSWFWQNSSVVAYRLFNCLCVALSIQLIVCDFLFILNIKLYKIFWKNIVSNWIWSEIYLNANWIAIKLISNRSIFWSFVDRKSSQRDSGLLFRTQVCSCLMFVFGQKSIKIEEKPD